MNKLGALILDGMILRNRNETIEAIYRSAWKSQSPEAETLRGRVAIFDNKGAKVFSKVLVDGDRFLSFDELSDGTYLLRVFSGQSVFVSRVIVLRKP